jgi:hypothetical protein
MGNIVPCVLMCGVPNTVLDNTPLFHANNWSASNLLNSTGYSIPFFFRTGHDNVTNMRISFPFTSHGYWRNDSVIFITIIFPADDVFGTQSHMLVADGIVQQPVPGEYGWGSTRDITEVVNGNNKTFFLPPNTTCMGVHMVIPTSNFGTCNLSMPVSTDAAAVVAGPDDWEMLPVMAEAELFQEFLSLIGFSLDQSSISLLEAATTMIYRMEVNEQVAVSPARKDANSSHPFMHTVPA